MYITKQEYEEYQGLKKVVETKEQSIRDSYVKEIMELEHKMHWQKVRLDLFYKRAAKVLNLLRQFKKNGGMVVDIDKVSYRSYSVCGGSMFTPTTTKFFIHSEYLSNGVKSRINSIIDRLVDYRTNKAEEESRKYVYIHHYIKNLKPNMFGYIKASDINQILEDKQ